MAASGGSGSKTHNKEKSHIAAGRWIGSRASEIRRAIEPAGKFWSSTTRSGMPSGALSEPIGLSRGGGRSVASGDAQSLPLFQQLARGDSPRGDDGHPLSAVPETGFQGTVSISSERPAREMHQVVQAIIKKLTTIPVASVELKLEIDAEVTNGIDKGKSRTLLENASTLGFSDTVLD